MGYPYIDKKIAEHKKKNKNDWNMDLPSEKFMLELSRNSRGILTPTTYANKIIPKPKMYCYAILKDYVYGEYNKRRRSLRLSKFHI